MQILLETAQSIANVAGWREWAEKHLELKVGDTILVQNRIDSQLMRVDYICNILYSKGDCIRFDTDQTLLYNKSPLTELNNFIYIPDETTIMNMILKKMTDIHIHQNVLNNLSYRYECDAEKIVDYKSKKKITGLSLDRHVALFKIMFKLVDETLKDMGE